MESGVIRQCAGCSTWRHISWFDVGERHCKACQDVEKSYIDRLAEAVVRANLQENHLKGEMLAVVKSGARPEAINTSLWRVLHMLNEGMSPDAISIAHGVSLNGAEEMIQQAWAALLTEVQRQATEVPTNG
jgi:1,2-phenylacetyl-CoA epoxidase catalytic subunit